MDGFYVYRPGDVFPRPGISVSAERIKELSGKNNNRGKALIAELVEKSEEAEAKPDKDEPTKEEIEKMPYFGLKALCTKRGIDVKDKKTADLRKALLGE